MRTLQYSPCVCDVLGERGAGEGGGGSEGEGEIHGNTAHRGEGESQGGEGAGTHGIPVSHAVLLLPPRISV